MSSRGFYFDISDELENNANVHIRLVKRIEELTGANLLCYFATPGHPAGAIEDHDPNFIENILRSMDLSRYSRKLDLLLVSPGGLPYAAAKIVRVCRTFSQDFRVVVVERAMSAATLICLGATGLIMSRTASLGPIDPQMVRRSKTGDFWAPASVIIQAFKEMLGAAQNAILNNQPPEPFLHILDTMDVAAVIQAIQANAATKSIGVELSKEGLLKNVNNARREEIIQKLIDVGQQELHAKNLYAEDLKGIGIPVTILEEGEIDALYRQLYIRIERYASAKGLAKYFCSEKGGLDVNVQVRRI